MEDTRNKQIIQQVFETSLSGMKEDSWLAQRVLNKAHGEGEKRVKKKWTVGLILVIVILMCSLVGLAWNHSYVIQFLFGKEANSDEAQRLAAQVQSIDIVQKSDAYVCTVKDAYFDGKTLAVGIGFQADTPIYLVGEEVKVNGEHVDYVEYGSTIEEMWVGNQAPNEKLAAEEWIHGMECIFAQPLPKGERAEVTMHITLLKPRQGVKTVDVYQENHLAMWAEIDALYDQGLTPVSADEPYEVLISSGWHETLDRTNAYQGPLCDVDALVRYANMEVVDRVEVTFMLNVQ